MISCSASAPGKLVLCGEYVVLDGAPAISVAVSARAHVRTTPAPGDSSVLISSGFLDGEYEFSISADGDIRWAGDIPGRGFPLLESTLRRRTPAAPVTIETDTAGFCDKRSGTKFGLGSSAALTVALVAALHAKETVSLQQMVDLHRDFQGGRGSGVDIATSYTGGVVEYRMSGSKTTRREWPAGLGSKILWSGVSASTTNKLATFEAGDDMRISRRRLADASGRLADAWREPDVSELLSLLAEYVDALAEFDIDHNLGIFDAGHAELVSLAVSRGLLYKPCGAGGGDVGIVLSDDMGRLEDFVSEASSYGYRPLDLEIDDNGLKTDSKAP